MFNIKPIKDLRNTNEISSFCHENNEPVFITKNGYNDLVIMSDDCYKNLFKTNNRSKKIDLINDVNLKEQHSNFGFVRLASATIKTHIADVKANLVEIKAMIDEALEKNVRVLVFNELTLTGCSIKDLVLHDNVINECLAALKELKEYSKNKEMIFFVGLPFKDLDIIYDVCAVISKGRILGLATKKTDSSFNKYIKGYKGSSKVINLFDDKVLFGSNLLFVLENYANLKIAVEIGEDRNEIINVGQEGILNGASLIVSPSAEIETYISKEYIEADLKSLSHKYHCAYLYAGNGKDESSTDVFYGGRRYLFEDGEKICASTEYKNGLTIAEGDFDKLSKIRIKNNFEVLKNTWHKIGFDVKTDLDNLVNIISSTPFEKIDDLNEQFHRILNIQAHGLIKRMQASHSNKLVLALSGGLDSTIAVLVCKEAFDLLQKDPKDIYAVTIPCFGTSSLTKTNALDLANTLGCTTKVINIASSVTQHLKDIQHDMENTNVAFENAQARERTQVAMDLANDIGALMVGTGDLSELCLGWCTYGGDHMSMYGVNASLPKTLMQKIAIYYGEIHPEVKDVLKSVVQTPISPELLPLEEGEIRQKTEEKVGPYELIDFYIYYLLKFGYSPKKISFLAENAFRGKYDKEIINKWLKSFLNRFIKSQFKRSCLPDGVKVGELSISPRDGLNMPSDSEIATLLNF